MKRKYDLFVTPRAVLMLISLVSLAGPGGLTVARPAFVQGQVVSIGILNFQDESGTDAPPELGQKIAKDLQQKLAVTYKDVLPRIVGAGSDASAVKAMTVEQLTALGRQQGVKFLIRGGLYAPTAENAGAGTKITVHLYAEIVSVETGGISSVRAEGVGTQQGAASDAGIKWDSVNLTGSQSSSSALGQALSSSIEQLAAAIHQAVTSPVAESSPSGEQPLTAQAAQTQDTAAAADADEELQQLVAQAEALASGGTGSTESLKALGQALEGLKAALTSKASLMEQAQDTAEADQQVAARQQELQIAVDAVIQEASAADATAGGEVGSSSGEKKGILSSINDALGGALSILQKIQEMRATIKGANEDPSSSEAPQSPDQDVIAEEPTEEIDGVVTESGEPVEGVTVTEPESGVSATTDGDGSYSLKGVAAGRLTKLIITKAGKQMTAAQINLARGRSAVADFELKPKMAGGLAPTALRIIPSTVMVNAKTQTQAGRAGMLKGVAQDAQGRPLARALVTLKGLAVARTDSEGRYAFLNVPAGTHHLTVYRSGLRLKSERVEVAAEKSSETKIRFASNDRIPGERTRQPLIQRGTSTVLRGAILDQDKRPIAGAKITVMHAAGAVSVVAGSRGNYEVRDLKPGSYRLLVSKVGYEAGIQTVALRAGGTESRDFQLKQQHSALVTRVLAAQQVKRGEVRMQSHPINVEGHPLQLRKGQMSGRIVDAQTGKPIQGATVSLQRGQSVRTDRQGNYLVVNLSPGKYRISVNGAGFLQQERTITIRADNSANEDFALKREGSGEGRPLISGIIGPQPLGVRSGQLRGQITDARSGRPLGGASISIAGQRSVTTNQEGIYVINSLAPGTYQAVVSKSDFVDGGGALIVRAGETVTRNFKLNPKPSASIRLKIPKTQ